MRKILLLVFAFNVSVGSSQNIDSLLKIIDDSKTDSAKISIIIEQLINPFKGKGDFEKANKYYQLAQTFCKGDQRLQINVGIQYVNILIAQENYSLATDSINKIMVQAVAIKNVVAQAKCLRTKALINLYSGEYENAAELYYDALTQWKETGVLDNLAVGYSDLGMINYYLGHFDKAAMYWEKSVEIYRIEKDMPQVASGLGNLALAHIELKNYYKAEVALNEAITLNLEEKNFNNLAPAYTNYCKLEYQKGNIQKAIEYNNKAMEYYLKINDVNQLSNGYSNSAELARSIKRYDEALIYINKAFEYENQRENKNNLSSLFLNRAAIYSDIGKNKEAYEDLQKYIEIKDSLINSDNQKTISELEKKYELSEKEKENQLLNEKLRVNEVESSRQQITIILIGIILLIVAIVVFVLIKQNRQKNKINLELGEKNNIIEEKNKLVEAQHKDITDSIKYAERIQKAILPPAKLVQSTLPNSFVYFKPKDILSGDFYWMEETKSHIFLAVADCTGHGVPGALISIINYNLLNKAVLEQHLSNPADILNAVNGWLTQVLHQSFNEDIVKDGMDVTLLAINKKNKEVVYAGAMNSIYVVSENNLEEYKGNKFPVGAFIEDNPQNFTSQKIKLKDNDIIYLFTDGYADQFGGQNGKKLKYKLLKEVLISISNLPVDEQKQHISKVFLEWKGDYDQVDDVCLIGIKV
ncbi:SpoIIE family protein phosphatase [Sediminibacterium sp.]|uniref:SpoIIE family protein phosphatase n=1 Tax=Sediminibacterium sp. TaxID=1917865 RepID=UPI0027340AE0|nr:SpoIIE family protein phosphatase [Sediminibacterium sp.]MDP3567646.1 SpoIIE family protein phosphatase [Sediminibacterium sp.]